MVSDFDEVLERLLSDPGFAAALAADPAGTLAGYRLEPDEVALLHTQVGGDSGGQSGVEVRANQSSLFGMLSPLTGLAGALPGYFDPGPSGASAAVGLGPAGDGTAGMGSREPIQGMGPRPDPVQGMGPPGAEPPGAGPSGAGAAGSAPSGGPVPSGLADALGAGTGDGPVGNGLAGVLEDSEPGFGSAGPPQSGPPQSGPPPTFPPPTSQPPPGSPPAVPDGYQAWVDTDGDGVWDRRELRGRADGGIDILVDSDGDGRADFVGHDLDADGLVDVSEYDRDRDGFFERRMYDDDGDGWMDRSVPVEPPPDPVG